MMIKREVFLRLIEVYPESKIRSYSEDCIDGDWLYDFFPSTLQDDGALLSEEFGFCKRWRATGGRIWIDPTIRLQHVGTHTYTGDPMALFPTEAPPAAA